MDTDSRMGGALLLLFTLLNLFEVNDTSCLYNCCNCGEVSPVNVYTSLGSTLKLTCKIQKDNSSYHLMFVFDNNEHNEVDQSHFIIRDKYEHDAADQSNFSTQRKNPIILNKVIQSFDDEGTYICYKDDKKVGSAYVEIEYSIHPVNDSDFVCELMDWDESLSCTWKIGTYRRESNIDVKVVASTMNHPVLNPDWCNRTSCEWSGPFGEPYEFKIHLTVNNTKVNEAMDFTFTREPRSMVKPAPVSHILADNITSSTCLTVKWNNSKASHNQIYKITMSNEWNSEKVMRELKQTGSQKLQDLEFCGLIPFTNYTFTIIRKPLRLVPTGGKSFGYVETGYWSDPMSVTIKTLPDVPASPPNITQGSFDRSFKDKIILYWKPIKRMDRHGIIESYRISYASQDGSNTSAVVSLYENVTLDLGEDMWYNVSVDAVTTEGYWSPSASLVIPPKTDEMILSESDVVMELNEDRSTANVRWKGREACRHYVIFWVADDTLAWQDVMYNTTVLDLPIPSVEKVGVSCSAELLSSASGNSTIVGGGFRWNKCIYFKGKAPALPASVTVTPHNKALALAWSIDCDDDSSYPHWFNVTWCELDERKVCQDSLYELLEPDERKYRIKELNFDKIYRVRINSVSKDGRVRINPDFSDESLVFSKYEDGANKFVAAIWPIASISIFILLLFVVVYVVRKYRLMDIPAVDVPDVHSKARVKDCGYTDDIQTYGDITENKDYKVLNDVCSENAKHLQHNITNGDIKPPKEGNSDFSEVPNILEDMKMMERVKKEKVTPQSSDYSKLVNASGQINNSEVFNRLVSQPESNQSKSPSVLSSSDVSQSKPASVLSSSDVNQSRPQTELSDNSKSTDHTDLKLHSSELDESSSSFSCGDGGYRHFQVMDSSSDTSAYLHSQSQPYSSSQHVDPYTKLTNEDSNAETEDELLVTSQNTEQNNGSSQSSDCCNSPITQTSTASLPPDTEQASIDNGALLPSDVCNPPDQFPQVNGSDQNRTDQTDTMEDTLCSNSSDCLTSSASDMEEGGYKCVDLNSGGMSSVQSSVYSQNYGN